MKTVTYRHLSLTKDSTSKGWVPQIAKDAFRTNSPRPPRSPDSGRGLTRASVCTHTKGRHYMLTIKRLSKGNKKDTCGALGRPRSCIASARGAAAGPPANLSQCIPGALKIGEGSAEAAEAGAKACRSEQCRNGVHTKGARCLACGMSLFSPSQNASGPVWLARHGEA